MLLLVSSYSGTHVYNRYLLVGLMGLCQMYISRIPQTTNRATGLPRFTQELGRHVEYNGSNAHINFLLDQAPFFRP